jgi:S1-C subfamily serine protease
MRNVTHSARLAAGLVLTLFLTARLSADVVFIEAGTQQGQGITAVFGQDCFVVTAAHVVTEPGVEIRILDGRSQRGIGVLTRTYPQDIALVRVPAEARNLCAQPHWPSQGNTDALLKTDTPGTIRRLDETAIQTSLAVRVTAFDDRYVTVETINKTAIQKTWSGATLWINDEVVGILVDAEKDPAKGTVYRREYLNALFKTFVRESLTPELSRRPRG